MIFENNMKIQEYSPFITGTITEFEDGTQELDLGDFVIVKTSDDKFVRPQNGDILDKIAFDEYRDIIENECKYWWLIAYANNIEFGLNSEEFAGKELIIPNILDFKLRN